MKKILLVLSCAMISIGAAAQDIYGEATYMSKTKMDTSWMDNNPDMTPERRKRVEQNMKQMTEKTFVLKFNRTTAVYSEEKELAAPGQRRGWASYMGTMMGGEKYKDIASGNYTEQRDLMGKSFLIQDSIPQLNWQITGEARKIGQYDVIKAVATKKSTAFDWANWRRKNRGNDAAAKKKDSIAMAQGNMEELYEQPDEIQVVAWFAPAIPVQHGPDVYGGLPGLILELNEGNTTLLCSEIVMNPENKQEFKAASKGEVVTQEEYDAILKEKMDEMRQRFRGRGRGGRGRR